MNQSATKHYLELLRSHYGNCSDYRIAQILGVSKQAVSRWSQGKGTIGDEPAAILADLLDLDGVEVLTNLYLERSSSRVTRNYFEEILERAKSAQGAVVLGLLAILSYPLQSQILF